MRFIWPVLSLLLAFPAWAQDWRVDRTRSEVRFVIRQMNVPVEGGFGRFNVTAAFDPSKPEAGQFRVEVDVTSLDTGSEEGNTEARRPAWFDAARFPSAQFVSTDIRRDGPGRFTMTGDISVKGKTRPVTVPLVLMPQRAGGWLVSGRFSLKRSDFDIGGGDWNDPAVLANEIEGRFKMLLLP